MLAASYFCPIRMSQIQLSLNVSNRKIIQENPIKKRSSKNDWIKPRTKQTNLFNRGFVENNRSLKDVAKLKLRNKSSYI